MAGVPKDVKSDAPITIFLGPSYSVESFFMVDRTPKQKTKPPCEVTPTRYAQPMDANDGYGQ